MLGHPSRSRPSVSAKHNLEVSTLTAYGTLSPQSPRRALAFALALGGAG
jgi:hypothetical protein